MKLVRVSVEDMKCFWKANFSWDYPMPIGVFGALVVFVLQYSSRMDEARKVLTIFALYEMFLPLLFSTLVASLIPLEVEQGTLDLLMTYPKPRWVTLLYKLSLPVCLMFAIFLFTTLVSSIYVNIDLWLIVKVSLPPILFLGSATLLVSMLFKSYIASVGFAVLCWGAQLLGSEKIPRSMFLFAYAIPGYTQDWGMSKIVLGVVSVCCLIGSLYIFNRGLAS